MIRMQLIYVIIAGFLLQILILKEARVNGSTVDTVTNCYLAERAIATADECLTKYTGKRLVFDEYLIGNSVSPTTTDQTTKVNNLSNFDPALLRFTWDTNELSSNSNTFDDVDDYNNFDTLIAVDPNINYYFFARCKVRYYDWSTRQTTNNKTWHKKVTVTLYDSIKVSGGHLLVDNRGNKLTIQKSTIRSFSNVIFR